MINKSVKPSIQFTGERLIPMLNKGKTFYYEHLCRYLFASCLVKNQSVLDAGCGVGYGSFLFSKAGAKKVVGIDISSEAIEYARVMYESSVVKFHTQDVEKISQTIGQFERVVAFEVIEHLNDQNAFLNGVKTVLSKNGVALFSTPNKERYLEKNKFHVHELTIKQFHVLLKKHFRYVEVFDQSFYFTNMLRPYISMSEKHKVLDTPYEISPTQVYIKPLQTHQSRYVVAMCSDSPISEEMRRNIAIATKEVDEFTLEDGVEGITHMFSRAVEESATVKELKRLLQEIQSARFYKLWQRYVSIKRSIFGQRGK